MIKTRHGESVATVQELIGLLHSVEDKSLPVVLEGCDCYGSFSGKFEIKEDSGFYGSDKYVLLNRSD